jgi:hypothetical protein
VGSKDGSIVGSNIEGTTVGCTDGAKVGGISLGTAVRAEGSEGAGVITVEVIGVVAAFDGTSRLGAKGAGLARAGGSTASAWNASRGADGKPLGAKVGFDDTDIV